MVDCTFNYGNGGCAGGYMVNTYRYVVDYGVAKAKDYPYVGHVWFTLWINFKLDWKTIISLKKYLK